MPAPAVDNTAGRPQLWHEIGQAVLAQFQEAGAAALTDGSVTTAKIVDLAVTTDKLALSAVTSTKLADGAVTLDKVPDATITAVKLAATGARDGTKFLRDDNTWQAISGGGDMLKSDLLGGLSNYTTARTNLGLGSLATKSAIATGDITDGAILDADVNAAAGIALSKLATDPLARANHTGTQLMSTISNAGNSATLNVGTATNTVAAGDDSRITGAAQKSANLSDLSNSATAVTNLGLVIGTNTQAYDPDLTAIAALTSAADKLPYATGAGTWALATFTSAGRALVDDADAAAMRTTMGVAIGTNVQAYSTDLAAIAALTSAGNKLPYATGGGTWAMADLSSAGRALIDDADAAAQRTTLGLGSLAVVTPTGTPTGSKYLRDDNSWQTIAGGGDMLKSDNLSGLASTATSRTNLGVAIGSNVQAWDADLDAIAALVSAANKLPYATGAGTWALADFSAAGRALVDDADAAAQRTTLGVAIGSNVQAWDADLDAIAALASAADKFPYATGAQAWALATVTSFARTILDDVDAATSRTTLGVAIGSNVQAWDTDLDALAGLTYAADTIAYFTGAHAAATTTLSSYARTILDDADAATARATLGVRLNAYKTADESVTNSATIQDDDHLSLTLTAGRWRIQGLIIADGSTAGDIKMQMDYSGTVTAGYWTGYGATTASSGASTIQHLAVAFGTSQPYGCQGAGTKTTYPIFGTINVSTGGTLKFRWAQNTSDGTATTVYTESHLSAYPLT